MNTRPNRVRRWQLASKVTYFVMLAACAAEFVAQLARHDWAFAWWCVLTALWVDTSRRWARTAATWESIAKVEEQRGDAWQRTSEHYQAAYLNAREASR